MKVRKRQQPQPAHKSYFFGQGFVDIGNAIKTSWQRNAQAAFQCYTRYEMYGLMSFTGLFNLFRALAVVSFGTVFFAAISAVMVLVVSVFFIIVYLGFSVTWLLDRAYLVRNRIFTACHECKQKSLIPTYICPSCGAQHTNLTPGSYGILWRKCSCGQKLPATCFNGRAKLKAICPHCLEEGRTTYLNDRESRPFCVPVVGGRSVGKTAYITAFSRKFLEEVAPAAGLETEFYSDAKRQIFDEIQADYQSGATRMTARAQDVTQSSSVSFSFFVKHKRLTPERLVHIYDIAGEVFTDNAENEVQRQYEYCQGIIFMIDPFAIPSVRAHYELALDKKDLAGIGRADINGVINVFINKLREVTGLSDQRMSQVPLAVVIGKTDAAGLDEHFSQEKIADICGRGPNITPSDAEDWLCREFLRENEMAGFISAIDMQFKVNRFFAASAIGHPRDEGEYRPRGVLEPMEWICQNSDRAFASLWTKGRYSAKPLSELPEGGGQA